MAFASPADAPQVLAKCAKDDDGPQAFTSVASVVTATGEDHVDRTANQARTETVTAASASSCQFVSRHAAASGHTRSFPLAIVLQGWHACLGFGVTCDPLSCEIIDRVGGVAQLGSALALGARGRWFGSGRPDH